MMLQRHTLDFISPDKGTEEHYAKESDLPLQHLLESSLILFDWTQLN
jgi:hypothetical protein